MATQIMTPAGQLLSKNERAWWDAAAQAEGPYSPRPGRMSETFFGSSTALQSAHAVDLAGFETVEDGQVFQVLDASGQTWYCRRRDGFWAAFRDRTDDEVLALIERTESRFLNTLPTYALQMCKRIAIDLYIDAGSMTPDAPMPRSARRELKRRLTRVANLLDGLLWRTPLSLGKAEKEMRALGIRWDPIDPHAWLDANA